VLGARAAPRCPALPRRASRGSAVPPPGPPPRRWEGTASQLRAPVAAVVTALTIGCGATVLALVEPPAEALVDAVFIGMVHAATAALLVLAKNRVERLMGALERQAAVDGLTGLVTRRVLDDALAGALSASATPEGTALVLVDVDTVTSINDRHGHPVGDDALVHLAGVLRRHVRAQDAVLGRLGGDELAVLLPGCSPATAGRTGRGAGRRRPGHPAAAGRRHAAGAVGERGHRPRPAARHRAAHPLRRR
jgi:GGDEF domain-containing protein